MAWETRRTGAAYDLLAPDGSEIRVLVRVSGASMVHCTLQPGQATQAVRHRTVEEMWFCVAGAGQMWRRLFPTPTPIPTPTPGPTPTPPSEVRIESPREEVVDLEPGVALSIPLGVAFQFRASGPRPLEVVIATIPSWPGDEEAVPVEGVWEATPR